MALAISAYRLRDMLPEVFDGIISKTNVAISGITTLEEPWNICKDGAEDRTKAVFDAVRDIQAGLRTVKTEIVASSMHAVEMQKIISSQQAALQFYAWTLDRFLEREKLSPLPEYSAVKFGLMKLLDEIERPTIRF
jgi:hypothetical protein